MKTKVIYKVDGSPCEFMMLSSTRNTPRNRSLIELEFRLWCGKHQDGPLSAEIVRIESA